MLCEPEIARTATIKEGMQGIAKKGQTSASEKDQKWKSNAYEHVQDDGEPIWAGRFFPFHNHIVTCPPDHCATREQFKADNEQSEDGETNCQHGHSK